MLVLITVLTFLGFYLFYQTSRRIVVERKFALDRWIYDHFLASRILGALVFVIAQFFSIIEYGVGSGTFLFFILLTTVASLVIIIAPLATNNK